MTIQQLQSGWADTPQHHKHIDELFTDLTNKDQVLKQHRDWCDKNIYAMGERSFWYAWKLILESLPNNPGLLEIGVHRGAVLSLWKRIRPDSVCFGVSPLDGAEVGWANDFLADIYAIHDNFDQPHPKIWKGYSQDEEVVKKVSVIKYNLLYIDGSHEYSNVLSDLQNYAPMVIQGGILVMDDCCCDFHMYTAATYGEKNYFQGIQPVNDAFADYMKEHGHEWEFLFNVVHLRVLMRI